MQDDSAQIILCLQGRFQGRHCFGTIAQRWAPWSSSVDHSLKPVCGTQHQRRLPFSSSPAHSLRSAGGSPAHCLGTVVRPDSAGTGSRGRDHHDLPTTLLLPMLRCPASAEVSSHTPRTSQAQLGCHTAAEIINIMLFGTQMKVPET